MPGESAPADILNLSVAADPAAIRQALGEVTAWLAEARLDTEELSTVELVLAETLNNIAEHAYRERGGEIELSVALSPRGVRIATVDEGEEMPRGALPSGTLVPFDERNPAEGGYGWFIIRAIVHDLLYHRESGRNHVSYRVAAGISPARRRGTVSP